MLLTETRPFLGCTFHVSTYRAVQKRITRKLQCNDCYLIV